MHSETSGTKSQIDMFVPAEFQNIKYFESSSRTECGDRNCKLSSMPSDVERPVDLASISDLQEVELKYSSN